MSIMQDYARKYDDSIQSVLNLNALRNEYNKKINLLNKLKKENLENRNEYYVNKEVRNRKIITLEKELFHSR